MSRTLRDAELIESVHRVAQLAANGTDVWTLMAAVETEVAQVLRLDRCRFNALGIGRAVCELALDRRVLVPCVAVGDGIALPAQGVALAVRTGGMTWGWLVGTPAGGVVGVSLGQRRTALSLAGYLALSMWQAESAAA